MALRLVKSFRKNLISPLPIRGRPAASEDIVEPGKDYYIVKDYKRNPFYMSMLMATRPGYKYDYDPFKKWSERREAVWEPRYKHQQIDISMGWSQIFFFVFISVQFFVCFHFETKINRHNEDPLNYNLGRPHEY